MPQTHNIELVRKVARRLGDLCEKVVFIGGSTTGLYITDPAAPVVRSTVDVDVIVEAISRTAYYRLGEELRTRGFSEDKSEGAPLCRWIVEGVKVDVMPTDTTLIGFSNSWYASTVTHAHRFSFDDGTVIRFAAPPHFIATKIEAFNGRGRGDFLASPDMEDIIAVIDGRPELAGEVAGCQAELRSYIVGTFDAWLANSAFIESIAGQLPPDDASQARKKIILSRVKLMVSE